MKTETENAIRSIASLDPEVSATMIDRVIEIMKGTSMESESLIHVIRYNDALELLKVSRRTLSYYVDKGYLDRGIKERPSLCVLRETMMPSALVELGFIDSEDVWLLKEHQEDMAKALALGIMDYWKTV